MTNSVSIIKSPLIANAISPLQKDLDDNITLADAVAEAEKYAHEKGYITPTYLYWNGGTYRFMDGGVFLMDENNRPKKKVG